MKPELSVILHFHISHFTFQLWDCDTHCACTYWGSIPPTLSLGSLGLYFLTAYTWLLVNGRLSIVCSMVYGRSVIYSLQFYLRSTVYSLPSVYTVHGLQSLRSLRSTSRLQYGNLRPYPILSYPTLSYLTYNQRTYLPTYLSIIYHLSLYPSQ